METTNNPLIDSTIAGGNPNTPILKSALFYGLILSGISIGLGMVAHFIEWDTQSSSYKLLTYAILIGGPIWAIWHYKTQKNKGYLRYGQGVGLSVMTGLIAGVIGAIFLVVYMKFINTNMVEEIMESSYEQMVDQGLNETQIEQAMQMSEMFMTPGFFATISILTWLFISLIIGLIVSAIMKRD